MNKFKLLLISGALLISTSALAYTCPDLTTNNSAVKNSLASFCNYFQSALDQKKKAFMENFTRIPPPQSRTIAAPPMQGRIVNPTAPAAPVPSNTGPAKLVR